MTTAARIAAALSIVALYASASFAQAGGDYVLRNTIDGGAGSASGGTYQVDLTIAQPAAGGARGDPYFLGSGFWGGSGGVAASSPTVTVALSTRTATAPPSPTQTATAASTAPGATPSPTAPAATRTPSSSPTASPGASVTPTARFTTTAPPTPTPTPTTGPLRGDASCDGRVGAADLPALIGSLGTGERAACGLDDVNQDMHVDNADVEALVAAIFDEP